MRNIYRITCIICGIDRRCTKKLMYAIIADNDRCPSCGRKEAIVPQTFIYPKENGVKMSNVMTLDHPRWDEFAERLEGPEGCNFTAEYDETGNYIANSTRWKCAGGTDKTFATAILEDMGMDVDASLRYFEANGGFCDCEILFNIDSQDESD